jgi:hypothetical protein
MKVTRVEPVKIVDSHPETYNIEGLTFKEMDMLVRMSWHTTCIDEECEFAHDFFALMEKIRKARESERR